MNVIEATNRFQREATWSGAPDAFAREGDSVRLSARHETDLFDWPGIRVVDDLPAWTAEIPGEFTLTAKISVDGIEFADAGGLLVRDGSVWAKHALERGRDRNWMVASVVNHGTSDDCAGPIVDSSSIWLQMSRAGHRILLTYSADGIHWRFSRTFLVNLRGSVAAGCFVQAPFSQGCAIVVEQLSLNPTSKPDRR